MPSGAVLTSLAISLKGVCVLRYWKVRINIKQICIETSLSRHIKATAGIGVGPRSLGISIAIAHAEADTVDVNIELLPCSRRSLRVWGVALN